MKKIAFIMFEILTLLLYMNISYADDYLEEDYINDSIEDIIQTAAGEAEQKIELNSRIAVAFDRASEKVIWGKNENKKTAMASTTKIMTAIVVIESSNLDDVVEISPKAASTGGSRLGLKKGDKVTLRDLLYGLMLRSGNDAAVAIAEHVGGSVQGFSSMMNEKSKALNLKNTHFVTPHGLDDPEHYTTAYELAQIANYALKNETFSKIVGSKNYTITINGYPKSLNNTNELLGYIDGVYGVKTGFTNNAGRCLVTAVKKSDLDIITVVIQADTRKDRAKDSIKLINYIFENYEKANIKDIAEKEFSKWLNLNRGRININKSKDSNISIGKENIQNEALIIKKSDLDKIRIEVNAIYEFEAPVLKNTILGEMKIFVNDTLIEADKIFFTEDVNRKDMFDYIRRFCCSYKI